MRKLEKHVWNLVSNRMERIRQAAKEKIRENGWFPPTAVALAYCPKCDDLTSHAAASLFGDLRMIVPVFPRTVLQLFDMIKNCDGCGEPTLPAGYVFAFKAQMIGADGRDIDEVEAYIRAFGTFKNLPDVKEGMITAAVTTLGKKMVIAERIIRRKGGVEFAEVGTPDENPKAWFILPLPKVKGIIEAGGEL